MLTSGIIPAPGPKDTAADMRSDVAARPGWTSAPWGVWAYGVIQLVAIATWIVAEEFDITRLVGVILFELAIFVGLLHGARLAWIVAMLFLGFGVLGSAAVISRIVEGEGENIPLDVARVSFVLLALIALLHPRTRAWTRPR